MMQRSPALAPPRPAPWVRPRAALARLQQRISDPSERPTLLWHAAWFPFRVWSDAPEPALPHRDPAAPGEIGLAGQAVVGGIDRIRRRLWISHALAAICRGIWLGLLVAALLMLLDLLGGPVFDPRPALGAGIALLAAALLLAALSKPSRLATARMLDRSFGLHERLTTALGDLGLGVPASDERAPVVYLQMADAANALAVLRKDRRLRPELPVREVVLIVFMALVLATLAFARGLGGGLPALATLDVPEFTPAIERPAPLEPTEAEIAAAANAPTVHEVLERSDRSSRARRDLQTLAQALADHAATRPAADQIAQGNYPAASERLRETAAQAGNLSPEARSGLSGDLQQASEAMEPDTNGLHEATEGAATGLQQGDEAAQEGLRNLADAVERAGEEVVPAGELASQMRNAQQTQGQSGGESRSAASPPDGEMSAAASAFSASTDPASAGDASAPAGSEASEQSGQQGSIPGNAPGEPGDSPPASSGQPGQASAPVEGNEGGQGENQAPGAAASSGDSPAGMEGAGDAETARQGGGAGTGESAQAPADGQAGTSSSALPAPGEAANPDVSGGGSAQAEPSALEGNNTQVALPSRPGEEGVQTSTDGDSAMRGSGAGVTAGSGFAVQGEVGEAGPDSNRVPAEHRDVVERYFSAGGNE